MKVVFKGGGWTLTEEEASLPDGRVSKKVRVEYADTAHIVAEAGNGKIVVIREYRPFYGAYIWMLTSGHVDKEADPLVAAQRELQEETGWRAEILKPLWTVRATEKFKNSHHFFLAQKLVKDPLPGDADEMIETHEMSPEEALEKIEGSPNIHMASAYGLRRYISEKTQNKY